MTTTTSKTIKPGKIAVASARELQQKAQAALKASKTPKGKPEKAAVAAALRGLMGAQESLCVLADFGKAYQGGQLDSFMLRESIAPIAGKVKDHFCEAMDDIAHLRHRATKFLLNACDALDCAATVAEMANGSDADDNDRSKGRRSANGKAIVGFVSEAARWMDRAERALSGSESFGWLSGLTNVAGVPEGKDVLTDGAFRMVDPQEGWVLDYFSRMTQEQRQRVADFITATAKEG